MSAFNTQALETTIAQLTAELDQIYDNEDANDFRTAITRICEERAAYAKVSMLLARGKLSKALETWDKMDPDVRQRYFDNMLQDQ